MKNIRLFILCMALSHTSYTCATPSAPEHDGSPASIVGTIDGYKTPRPWYTSPSARIFYALLILGTAILLPVHSAARRSTHRRLVAEALHKEREGLEKELLESNLRHFTHVSHEFGTLLTLIDGPCDRILSHGNCDPFVLRHTGLIRRNAERMNDLIGSVMEHLHTETGNRTPHIEPLNVSELAAAIFHDFVDQAASQGFTYNCDITPDVVWNSDRNFLTSIITNLILNAFKSTGRKGKIFVAASADDEHLRITILHTAKSVHTDNSGRKIDEVQARDTLGLTVARNLTQLLGGRIEIGNAAATHLTVCLPAAEPSPDADDVKNAQNTALTEQTEVQMPVYIFDERKPTIMVIDGLRDMLCFIGEIFAADYNVVPVDTPSKIVPLMEEITPSVILCDAMMPELDGIALAHMLRSDSKSAHIPLILLSAKHSTRMQVEALEAGADLYITKPFKTECLKASVRRLISRGETLREYLSSPQSAWELTGGRITHVDHRRFVQQILDIITENLRDRRLSVQFLADKMNMSPRHLHRKLQEIGAQSPSQMIRDSRLHVAVDLLQNTTMTVDEIIYKSGFPNRGPFFNAFSEKFGCTPREYRGRHIRGIV